jgi:hypothetical protein
MCKIVQNTYDYGYGYDQMARFTGIILRLPIITFSAYFIFYNNYDITFVFINLIGRQIQLSPQES